MRFGENWDDKACDFKWYVGHINCLDLSDPDNVEESLYELPRFLLISLVVEDKKLEEGYEVFIEKHNRDPLGTVNVRRVKQQLRQNMMDISVPNDVLEWGHIVLFFLQLGGEELIQIVDISAYHFKCFLVRLSVLGLGSLTIISITYIAISLVNVLGSLLGT